MLFSFKHLIAFLTLGALASASPLASESNEVAKRENDGIQYLGSQSTTLSGGTKFGDLVFVSGQVPLLNGTVVPGGVRNETAFVIDRIGSILAEAGTDWSRVLKVTVLLQSKCLHEASGRGADEQISLIYRQ
jgi:enamine deaminase RidA (YjgF/YER057c/UK114 family)